MLTVAKACDNNIECANEEDEKWFCTDPKIVFTGVILVFLLILVFVICIKVGRKQTFCQYSEEYEEEFELLDLTENILDPSLQEERHQVLKARL